MKRFRVSLLTSRKIVMTTGTLMMAVQFRSGLADSAAGTAAWTGGPGFFRIIGALAETIGYDPMFVCLALLDVSGAIVLWTLLQEGTAARINVIEAG